VAAAALRIAHIPRDHISFDQRNRRRQVHVITREAAGIFGFTLVDRFAFKLAHWVKAFEFQSTVVAEQFM
jgi:hypothetical protein